MTKEQKLFKDCCLSDGKPETILSLFNDSGLSPQKKEVLKFNFVPSKECRGCGRPVTSDNFAIWIGYWQSYWSPAHKECVKSGMKQEAIDCQNIDKDCNDCGHFKRGKRLTKTSFEGECFGKPVTANINFASAHTCFKHRLLI